MNKLEPMVWDSVYSVDVSTLDSQHKELIAFFNDAIKNCSGNETEELEYFNKTIDSFIDLLSKHFGTEELFLSGEDYAQYEEHKLDHIKLVEKIEFVKQEAQSKRWEMKLFILEGTLKDWLMRHFKTYDISAKEYFAEANNREINTTQTEDSENYFAVQV